MEERLLADQRDELGAEAAVLGASCTTTRRPVFFTLARIVSMSTGQSVREIEDLARRFLVCCASSAAAMAS